jgi:hypothetical protein
MLYVPEFYFHSIHNHDVKPYAIGLISRQCNIKRNIRASSLFTFLIALNHVVAGISDPEARVRILGLFGNSLMNQNSVHEVSKNNEFKNGYIN